MRQQEHIVQREENVRLLREHIRTRVRKAHALRDAGVSEEDRALLQGHAVEGMPQHYASATVARLVGTANSVTRTRDRMTLLRVANGRTGRKVAQKVAQ